MSGENDRLQAYLDGTLSAADRARFEEEASEAPELRRRLVALHRARQPAPQWGDLPADVRHSMLALAEQPWRSRRRASAALLHRARFALVAASVVLAGGLGLWWAARTTRTPIGEPWRGDAPSVGSPGTVAAAVELSSPAPDAQLRGPSVELAWTAVTGAAGYEVVLLDARGDIQATIEVAEPRYRLDLRDGGAASPLERCWYVVAKLADGGRLTSEARCWTLAPAR